MSLFVVQQYPLTSRYDSRSRRGSLLTVLRQSLERMAVSLAQDKLGYTQVQLAALSNQIRMGDFTPILEIYEDDIKQPLKSVIVGSLLRSLFVQVQKAKVSLELLLSDCLT